TALTRSDVLFILGFLAGARNDPIHLKLIDALEERWTRPAPEGGTGHERRPGADLFSAGEVQHITQDARGRHIVERFKVPRGIPDR
nr:hypothetical protein [Gemmatimonadaceae bacterium]